MRGASIFIVVAACAGAPAPRPAPVVPVPVAAVSVTPPPAPPPLPPVPPPPILEAPPPPIPQTCPAAAGRDPKFGAVTLAAAGEDPRFVRAGTALLAVALGGELAAPTVMLASSPDDGASWSEPHRADAPADCAGLVGCPLDPQLVSNGRRSYVLYAGDPIGLRVREIHDHDHGSVLALAGTVAGAAISADGRLHVAAVRGGPLGGYGAASHTLEYAVLVGGVFSRAVTVSGRDELLPLVAGRPAIAIDSSRRLIYVAYVRGGRDLAWSVVLAVSKDRGATWRRTEVSAPSLCAVRVSPALAIDPTTGVLHVAWFDARGTGALAHAACASGGAKCAELGTISDAPIAIDPATPPPLVSLAVDSKRRTLRAVWTAVDTAGARQVVTSTSKLPLR